VDGFGILDRVQPVSYKWNGLLGHPNDGREMVGVIAQELESIAPYAVGRIREALHPDGEKTDVLEIDIAPLIMLLVNAVRELEDRLNVLRQLRR